MWIFFARAFLFFVHLNNEFWACWTVRYWRCGYFFINSIFGWNKMKILYCVLGGWQFCKYVGMNNCWSNYVSNCYSDVFLPEKAQELVIELKIIIIIIIIGKHRLDFIRCFLLLFLYQLHMNTSVDELYRSLTV